MSSKAPVAQTAQDAEAKPARLDVLDLAGWAVFLAVAGFVFLFLLPAKGTEFTDEGWYLQASLAAATGQGFDSLLPQSPFYLIGAFFMKLGLTGVLAQRDIYHALIVLCLGLFAWGITDRRPAAFCVSLGLSVSLTATLTSLLSYENSPLLFALAGMGLYTAARNRREKDRASGGTLLRVSAGACLGMACCINPTTGPIAAVLVVAAAIADRTGGAPLRLILAPAAGAAVVFGGLFGWYLGSIGLTAFFTVPATYGLRLEKILSVLEYTIQWPILLGAVFGAGRLWRRLSSRKSGPAGSLTFGLLAVLTLSLAVFMAAQAGFGAGRGVLAPAFRAAAGLGLAWISRTPELLSFQLLLFFGFAFLTLALLGGSGTGRARRLAAAAAGIIGLYWFNQEILTAAPVSLKTFFAGPLYLTAFFLLHRLARQGDENRAGSRTALVFACFLTVAACAVFTSVNFSHPGHVSPLGPKVETGLPGLEGLRDTPERAELLRGLAAAYARHDCAGKTLITFQKTSLLGYLFGRKLPDGLSYIWPHFRFPEDRLRQEIDSGRPYCVFVSKNGESDANWRATEPFLGYLAARSSHVETIRAQGDRDPANPFTLYVGPAQAP
ncbi:MAG: hypothetical protein GYA47_11765 [Desulfovibrio sp.]|nr:hypothetical protein [Desulfovibrio sp.]